MTNGPPPTKVKLVLGSVLREPTVHFALIAALLFILGTLLRREDDATEIRIDRQDVLARIELIEEGAGASLTREQRQQVEDDYIDEQILVREALALGLEDDPRIHDFLAQKMLHVLSADVIQPDDAELETFFQLNGDRYASEETVAVEEVVIGTSEPLPAALLVQLQEERPAEGLETDLPLRSSLLSDVSARDLTDIFGPETGGSAFRAAIGAWTGPHPTVRGQHWLRVTERTLSVIPPLDGVREQVRLDWIVEQEEVRLRERVAELRARYSITVTGSDPDP